jgi:hypothetical protein
MQPRCFAPRYQFPEGGIIIHIYDNWAERLVAVVFDGKQASRSFILQLLGLLMSANCATLGQYM